ncbi:indole-3-glycerol phosphate synthase [Peptoclostridium litorale DSM 5388]|uniref:Indole-3-glycerol phosphate synthase n=1 Tax=Peptoclostridium litorale DSM 5388 TaxID=1121324 RepID=A0A069RFQ5_PEPLI|nr:indole-3-glycerol phosphate synthase TrpC [Peptoclostridium litorale]KDR95856.1 indole-3-glycerol phosphate synthase TrpC [Peptoclostridium litorale DSM 5388]SIO11275.1 indole-3-glycerol phosphate synthase [Peptoclostridium litorale DSM 5388]
MILQKIVDRKKQRVQEEKSKKPLEELLLKIESMGPCRDFKMAIERGGISLIAEVKKASPSRGVMKEDFDPEQIAREYEKAGVDAVSVITEEDFFLGKPKYLKTVRDIVSVPVLRKDFIIDPYQIYQSRAMGADAILLIASILTKDQLAEFYEIAKGIGIHCLVETHTIEEVEKAISAGAQIIGINNRDLSTFKTDISKTAELIKHIPKDKIVVSESGIMSGEDSKSVHDMGADAVLVGQSIMESGSIADKVKELKGE